MALHRAAGPERRLAMAVRLSEDVRTFSRMGIRQRHPEYSKEEIEAAIRRLVLRDDLYRKVWPQGPLVAL